MGTFRKLTVLLPRARLIDEESGREPEWRSRTIRAHKRLTKRAEAVIVGACLAGTNTRRVRRALMSLFGGAVSKDTVSRAWRKVQSDWQAWQGRDLSQEHILRLILDGTVVKVRLGKRVSALSLLVVLGVRRNGQKIMYAADAKAVRKKRKAFLAKWRLRCRGVADSLEEAGERLFTFLRYPPEEWKSLRTTNAIERLHEEFKRRIKTQCALPSAETAAMLFWALMASIRK